MQITILSLDAKALPVCQALRLALEAEELGVSVVSAEGSGPDVFSEGGFYIIVTPSMVGADPSEALAQALERARPDLSGGAEGSPLDYAVIEIEAADATAAPRLDPVLASLGARRIGHSTLTGTADAQSAITAAETWVRKVVRTHEGEEDPTLMP